MDFAIQYRLVAAVRRSLEGAGFTGFILSRVESYSAWFERAWMADYLAGLAVEEVPLLWEGLRLEPFSHLVTDRDTDGGSIRRDWRATVSVVEGRVVLALLSDPYDDPQLIVGEREEGALERFLAGYARYAHERSRSGGLITVIGGSPIPRPTGLGWDSLYLRPDLRDEIRLQVEGFFAARDAYRRMGVPYRRGMLLTGPPGNGKTTLLRVLASQRPEAFVFLVADQNTDQDLLDQAFDRAAAYAPSLLCLEDIDTLFDGKVPLSHFLNRLDGMESFEGVLIVATTNHPERLDSALTDRPSRFDRVFVLESPPDPVRRAYLRSCFGEEFDDRLVPWTEGLTMAQLKEVWISACLEAIHRQATAPSMEAARTAADRLRTQHRSVERDWDGPRAIGFQLARARADPPATS